MTRSCYTPRTSQVSVLGCPLVRTVAGRAARLCALAILLLHPPEVSAQKAVAQRAADYVAEYQRQLIAIVADEKYVQDIRSQIPEDPGAPRSRSTTGEVFFIFTAPARGWMAIRDVRTVDGAPAPERTDVRAILATLPATEVGERMRSYNPATTSAVSYGPSTSRPSRSFHSTRATDPGFASRRSSARTSTGTP